MTRQRIIIPLVSITSPSTNHYILPMFRPNIACGKTLYIIAHYNMKNYRLGS